MDKKKTRSKIEQYIDSRIWNASLKEPKIIITTSQILHEIEWHYLKKKKMSDDPDFQRQLTMYIHASRLRSRNSWAKYMKRSGAWALMLGTDSINILELIRSGQVKTLSDVKRIRDVLKILGHIPEYE